MFRLSAQQLNSVILTITHLQYIAAAVKTREGGREIDETQVRVRFDLLTDRQID